MLVAELPLICFYTIIFMIIVSRHLRGITRMRQDGIFAKPYGNTIAGLVLMAICTVVLYALMTLARPVTGFYATIRFDRELKETLNPLYKDPEEKHTPWSEITVSNDEYLDKAEQVCIKYMVIGEVSNYERDDEQENILVYFKDSGCYVIEAPEDPMNE